MNIALAGKKIGDFFLPNSKKRAILRLLSAAFFEGVSKGGTVREKKDRAKTGTPEFRKRGSDPFEEKDSR